MNRGRTEAPAATKVAVLYTHSSPPGTDDAVAAAVAAASAASFDLVAVPDEIEKHGGAADGVRAVESLPERPELCLVLGGDGTILKALREYADTGVPVFGINFGTVGFLAAAEGSDLATGLEKAFAGEYDVMSLPALELAGSVSGPGMAHNDVSFLRRPHARVAELSYRIAGQEVGHVRCDGLVAATPAGSTGYNLANQGPILAWGVKGYVVSFVAPHTLTARALVVAPDDVLHVRNDGGRDPVEVAVDGAPVGELASGEEIEVRFRDGVGTLAQLPGSNFYRRIREKFGRLAH
ncbi:MAG TPA: NAD(+)/NADH kinase [Solirubrobacterales bacterium]|nr:NAD(+)/NADH kinase [Solirubrobacterales bacterium]